MESQIKYPTNPPYRSNKSIDIGDLNHGGPSLAQFSYDGDGMRVVKTSAQGTTVYHHDKDGRVISETDNNGNRISDLVYANGKLVAKLLPTIVYFYHTDPVGTPAAMTDPGGSAVWRADYLPLRGRELNMGNFRKRFQVCRQGK